MKKDLVDYKLDNQTVVGHPTPENPTTLTITSGEVRMTHFPNGYCVIFAYCNGEAVFSGRNCDVEARLKDVIPITEIK